MRHASSLPKHWFRNLWLAANDSIRLLALITIFCLSACDSAMNKLADNELQDRMYECRASQSQSPGFAVSCDNYRRECLRRREQGKFLC